MRKKDETKLSRGMIKWLDVEEEFTGTESCEK